MNVLITGAGGFIGSFLVDSISSDSKFNVYALFRPWDQLKLRSKFNKNVQEIKIDTNICSVEAAKSKSQVDEHIFAPQTFARYIISNISDMSLEKFIELTLPLGHVATTTKKENTLLRNQKNIPILNKYEEADIKVYDVDVVEEILGLPQRIKDLLPKELVEVDNKQILDNTLYS